MQNGNIDTYLLLANEQGRGRDLSDAARGRA